MVCPSCYGKLEVVDTVRDSDKVYRRRKCKACGELVYTLESEVEPDSVYRGTWANLVYNSRSQNKEENK
jgi:transcriptional regulator NrdR family protein